MCMREINKGLYWIKVLIGLKWKKKKVEFVYEKEDS